MPRGLAIDRYDCEGAACERRLYVADVGKRSILAFKLLIMNNLPAVAPISEDGTTNCAIIANIEATWVTVDSDGNVYFNGGTGGAKQISMIPGESLREPPPGAGACTRPEPRVIYDGTSAPEVNAPGGLATDNFKLFWTNKAMGAQVGAVVSAATPPRPATDADAVDPMNPPLR